MPTPEGYVVIHATQSPFPTAGKNPSSPVSGAWFPHLVEKAVQPPRGAALF